jgi:hypothetical protein
MVYSAVKAAAVCGEHECRRAAHALYALSTDAASRIWQRAIAGFTTRDGRLPVIQMATARLNAARRCLKSSPPSSFAAFENFEADAGIAIPPIRQFAAISTSRSRKMAFSTPFGQTASATRTSSDPYQRVYMSVTHATIQRAAIPGIYFWARRATTCWMQFARDGMRAKAADGAGNSTPA